MAGGAGYNRGASQQDFATPAIFVGAALVKLDIAEFAFDFAASSANTVTTCYWDRAADALVQPAETWAAQVNQPYMETPGWGWLNPEFDRIAPWAARMVALAEQGGHGAFLVPAAVGSNWWATHVHGIARVLLLNGRIPFNPEKPHWGYPKDMTLCLYGPNVVPCYDVWRWTEDVPENLMRAHKVRCTAARLAETQARKQKPDAVVRTED